VESAYLPGLEKTFIYGDGEEAIKDIDLDYQQKGRRAREVGYHLECIQPVVKNVTQKVKSKTFSQAPDSARMGSKTLYITFVLEDLVYKVNSCKSRCCPIGM